MQRFTESIKDGHHGLGYDYTDFPERLPPPFLVHRVEGKPVVAAVLPQASPVQPGDVVLDVDDKPIADQVADVYSKSEGSNPAWRDLLDLETAIDGVAKTSSYQLRQPDGSVYKVQLRRDLNYYDDIVEGIPTAWQVRTLPGGCQMGIVNRGRLQADQVDEFAQAMANVDAIVFDVRNYPGVTLAPLPNYLYAKPREIARFEVADLHHPGTFVEEAPAYYGGYGTASLANKRLLVLVDARTMSHAEYTAMGLYADSARHGEGVDVHYDGRAVVAFAMNYDQHGQPTWLLASAPAARSADWGTKFYSFRPETSEPVHATAYSINLYRGPYTPPCAVVDQDKLFPRALWKSPGTGTLGDCVTPMLVSSGGPAAGVWTGPDGGWALSIQSDAKTLHLHLYGFDQHSNPRWLEGTGQLGDDGVADIALQRVHGYCATCAPTAVTEQAAGTIRLTVHSAAGGILTADINAMFGSQGAWIRTAVPLHRFAAMDQPVRAAMATLRAKPATVPTGLQALMMVPAGSP